VRQKKNRGLNEFASEREAASRGKKLRRGKFSVKTQGQKSTKTKTTGKKEKIFPSVGK